ncbi:unnamed protein product [Orchesella dallaii]|uniref:RING-type E3 ubiquitin transferase n=1 Tax=Orchesella dallaii TaxID=48710 RepID=A0ABP1PNN3_9HEXA
MEEHQSCPICFEIPSQEIYQCVGGHTICHTCVVKIHSCPHCRVPYGAQKIRNRVLEQILDNQTFDCVNAGNGCKEKLKRQDILTHAEFCSKRPIGLCKMLGYEYCTYVLNPSTRSTLIKHLTEEHGIVKECKTEVRVWHADFKSTIEASGLNNQMWNPTLLIGDADWYKDSLFLITDLVDGIRKCVSWNCLQVFGADTGSSYEAKFILKNEATDEPLITWITPVFNLLDNAYEHNDLLKISPCEVPFWLIKNACENGNDIPLYVQIRPTIRKRKGKQETDVEVWTFSTDTMSALVLDNASKPVVTHQGVICDGCGQKPITGKRHKCLQCRNYNLCTKCMVADHHAHHIFVVLATPEQAEELPSAVSAIR